MVGSELGCQQALLIVGPTGIGKTNLSMALQDLLGGVSRTSLISVDSAMIYRGMDIGTAKPNAAELEQHPLAMIDLRSPCEGYSVGEFVRDADEELIKARELSKIPILVGGTMLYCDRLLKGLANLPMDLKVRENLARELQLKGRESMYKKLGELDPRSAAKIHPNNVQRVLRALEVNQITGKSMSKLWSGESQGDFYSRINLECRTLILIPSSREALYQRVEERFYLMIQSGFLKEVEDLMHAREFKRESSAMRAVGYKQAISHLMGEISYDEFVFKATVATRNLVKRQLTWLKRFTGITRIIDFQAQEDIYEVAGDLKVLLG